VLSGLLLGGTASAQDAIGARRTVWERADIEVQRPRIDAFAGEYRAFLSAHKTEREVVQWGTATLDAAGFRRVPPVGLKAARPGDGLYWVERGKALVAVRVGRRPAAEGVRVLAAHIDAVRIDLKQNPLYEDGNLALAQTHYYGGLKKYQWLSRPMSLRGAVVLAGGRRIDVRIGDGPDEPVLVIPDLLAHLSAQVDAEEGEQVAGESLDPIMGSRPRVEEGEEVSEPVTPSVRQAIVELLASRYGFGEAELRTAELTLVPAGPAVDVGLDRSMIGGYGQDDRACAFAAMRALLDGPVPDVTSVVVWVDKEEIGSTGNTGAQSDLLARVVGELIEAQGPFTEQRLRRAFRRSEALSADATLAANPLYPGVVDPRNVGLIGAGPVMDQSGVHAEFMAAIAERLERADITFQTGEFGRANGPRTEDGTVLPYLSRTGMNAMDLGIPLLSMHAPFEVISRADLWEAYRAYGVFLRD